jgi:hypothetical protein
MPHVACTRSPAQVHGDMRCDNIYIDAETGNVRLGNFSLMHPSEEDPIRLTIGTVWVRVRCGHRLLVWCGCRCVGVGGWRPVSVGG